jgi:hypothetical protein
VNKNWFSQVPMREHPQDGYITFADGWKSGSVVSTKRSGSKNPGQKFRRFIQ